MELCNGTLKDFIEQNEGKHIAEKDILNILEQICKALEYIHLKGFTHRDIKPANILFKIDAGRKIWKITDFGASAKSYSLKDSYKTIRGVMTC